MVPTRSSMHKFGRFSLAEHHPAVEECRGKAAHRMYGGRINLTSGKRCKLSEMGLLSQKASIVWNARVGKGAN